MTKKPQVVYIASSWRSGSTLLDQVLGTSPNAFGTGELKSLERFVDAGTGRQDDAGHTAATSPIWQPFATDMAAYVPPAATIKMRFDWWERARIWLFGTVVEAPYRYCNEALYTTIQTQAAAATGKPVSHIIDSSKSLYRIIELDERTDLSVFVIHVVRDIRGVVASHKKTITKVSTWWAVRTWILTNAGIARYLRLRRDPSTYLRIRYEEFVKDPTAHITAINAATGLQVDVAHIVDAINREPSHRFSGNNIRRNGFTGFYTNEGWRSTMPKWQQWLLAIPNRLWY